MRRSCNTIYLRSDYGDALAKLGKEDEAKVQYKLSLSARPKHNLERLYQGSIAEIMKDSVLAERIYTELTERNPKLSAAWTSLLELDLKGRGNLKDIYARARKACPSDPTIQLSYADGIRFSEYEEAEALYKSAIELDPLCMQAYRSYNSFLAFGDRKRDRDNDRLALLRSGITHMPDASYFHSEIGELLSSKDPAEAVKELKLALDLDPLDSSALKELTKLLVREKQVAEARALFEKFLSLGPTSYLRQDYAKFLEEQGQTKGADEQYSLFLGMFPADGSGHSDYAAMLMKRKDYKGAEKYYRIALDLKQFDKYDPGEYDLLELAVALLRQGKRAEAITYAKKALAQGLTYHPVLKELGLVDK